MFKERLAAALLSSACLLVASCGGSGNSGGANSGSTPTPAPTAPTPTPSAPATVFSVVAAAPMLARIMLDTNNSGTVGDGDDAVSSTDVNGRFGRSITVLAPQVVTANVPSAANVRMEAIGIDAATGLLFSRMRAPAGSSVISPLTALIDAQGSEAMVRAALGLDSGIGALRGNVDLLTFNPALNLSSADADDRHNAARLTALNLQLLAMAAILKDTNGDPVDYGVTMLDGSRYMAQQISATGQLDLTSPATIRALLERSRYQFGSLDDQLDAMADLMARYNASVPLDLSSTDALRGWGLVFRFFVMPDFRIIASGWPNPAAQRIAAIDASEIAVAATQFAAMPGPVPGTFMAVPDFVELSDFRPIEVLSHCNRPLQLPSCNDRNPFTFDDGGDRLSDVTSGQPALVLVEQDVGMLEISRRASSLSGIVRVSYTSRTASGQSAAGSLYVRIRPPD